MSAATDAIKSLLAIKLKPRQDSYYDQFIRILMLKIMLVAALLVGLNWYSDKVTCILPEKIGLDKDFVSAACWINGLYIYEEIRYHANDVGYYGLPRDINQDGMFPNGVECATTDSSHRPVPNCKPMVKTFFLQYQYMTFYLLAIAVLYYAPYAMFRKVNVDMASLKGTLAEGTADDIVKNYFNDKVNPKSRLRLLIVGDIIVKILYILATVLGFILTNGILNGGFSTYGGNWLNWSKLPNALAYDYMGIRLSPKPGNELLPSFGLCEVHEAAQDVKTVLTNKHKVICEISQHILYQYVFLIVWFMMVASIIVSIVGLVHLLLDHILTVTCFYQNGDVGKMMYGRLALREIQYLAFIRRKNMPLYGEVIGRLKESRSAGLKKDDGFIPMHEGFKPSVD